MSAETSQILSAFVDGEPVDAEALAHALLESGGRDTLIDFVLVRGALVDDSRPSEAFYAAMGKRLTPRWRRGLRPLRVLAAAAVLALAVVGLFDLGSRLASRPRADEPPAPTRVLRFEPGVDWNVRANRGN
jgi:negative regulator of sigma E activity